MFEKWRIKEHMEVVDSSGRHVGTVDEIEGDQIKLTRSDASDGSHHYLEIDAVDSIEDNQVRLKQGTPLPEGRETQRAGTLDPDLQSSELQGANVGGSAGSADLPGYENKLFGTSGTGTGMGGSGAGEH